MFPGSNRRAAVTAMIVVATLTACGASSVGSPSGGAATPSGQATATTPPTIPATSGTVASVQCPSATTVGSALGFTVPGPTVVPNSGAAQLPAGAKGVACNYHGQSFNVIIELITNISPASITQFSGKFPVPFRSVAGVGDAARSFSQPLGGGKDNEGVVATKGSSLVTVVATATPASLAQVETLVTQLL